MIDVSGLNIGQLSKIYLVANIPSYLFRRYRGDASVREFAKANSVDDLVAFIGEIARGEQRTLEEITQAYAALVALSFKNAREVRNASGRVPFNGITWAEDILAFGMSQQAGNQELNIIPPPLIKNPTSTSDVGSIVVPIEIH